MACMFTRDENVNLCGVDTKIVTHLGRRSQLLLSAMRCGHPSSYIGSSVDRASITLNIVSLLSMLMCLSNDTTHHNPSQLAILPGNTFNILIHKISVEYFIISCMHILLLL